MLGTEITSVVARGHSRGQEQREGVGFSEVGTGRFSNPQQVRLHLPATPEQGGDYTTTTGPLTVFIRVPCFRPQPKMPSCCSRITLPPKPRSHICQFLDPPGLSLAHPLTSPSPKALTCQLLTGSGPHILIRDNLPSISQSLHRPSSFSLPCFAGASPGRVLHTLAVLPMLHECLALSL